MIVIGRVLCVCKNKLFFFLLKSFFSVSCCWVSWPNSREIFSLIVLLIRVRTSARTHKREQQVISPSSNHFENNFRDNMAEKWCAESAGKDRVEA